MPDIKEVKEITYQELSTEEIGTRVQCDIPVSLEDLIKKYQIAYKDKFSKHIGKPKVMLKLMSYGFEDLVSEIAEIKEIG